MHAIGGGRALKLYVVKLNLASDGHRTRRIVRLLLAIAAIGLSHDVVALKGGGRRQGAAGLASIGVLHELAYLEVPLYHCHVTCESVVTSVEPTLAVAVIVEPTSTLPEVGS